MEKEKKKNCSKNSKAICEDNKPRIALRGTEITYEKTQNYLLKLQKIVALYHEVSKPISGRSSLVFYQKNLFPLPTEDDDEKEKENKKRSENGKSENNCSEESDCSLADLNESGERGAKQMLGYFKKLKLGIKSYFFNEMNTMNKTYAVAHFYVVAQKYDMYNKYYVQSYDLRSVGDMSVVTPCNESPLGAEFSNIQDVQDLHGVFVVNVYGRKTRCWRYFICSFKIFDKEPQDVHFKLKKVEFDEAEMFFEHKWTTMSEDDIILLHFRHAYFLIDFVDSMKPEDNFDLVVRFEFETFSTNRDPIKSIWRGLEKSIENNESAKRATQEPKVVYMLRHCRYVCMETYACIFCGMVPENLQHFKFHLNFFHNRLCFTFSQDHDKERLIVSIELREFRLIENPPEDEYYGNKCARDGEGCDYFSVQRPRSIVEIVPSVARRNKQIISKYKNEDNDLFKGLELRGDVIKSLVIDENDLCYQEYDDREFYFAHTGLPKLVDDLDEDSEDDVFHDWAYQRAQQMIDECVDVNEDEAKTMLLWNKFMMSTENSKRYFSKTRLPEALREFVRQYGVQIIELNIRRNFILHVLVLYDSNVLSDENVIEEIASMLNQIEASLRAH